MIVNGFALLLSLNIPKQRVARVVTACCCSLSVVQPVGHVLHSYRCVSSWNLPLSHDGQ